MFRDRTDAGQQLARELRRFQLRQPLILALPRGGVVVGAVLAKMLHAELDVLLVKKLRAPGNPEVALGAICEDGCRYINEEVRLLTRAADTYLKTEIRERLDEMAGQRVVYRAIKQKCSVNGRDVVLVDDGLATGSTMLAAVQVTTAATPARLVLAIPVGPRETVQKLEELPGVEAVMCLEQPEWFGSVGQFYKDFRQIDDEEVLECLRSGL